MFVQSLELFLKIILTIISCIAKLQLNNIQIINTASIYKMRIYINAYPYYTLQYFSYYL